ncbi:PA3496 family putative envelope integrity protein [Enterovibrio norvegicus]|uniref:PA3496 family putative envelope integrity protein n=1 Tax=Enterovibrio norvegicus TaxID=188144 RepID=UPI0013000FBC|nr:hypothetical protein [Enterovibrio norvegicus]
MLKTSDPSHPFNHGYRGETPRASKVTNPKAAETRRRIEDIHEQRRMRAELEL